MIKVRQTPSAKGNEGRKLKGNEKSLVDGRMGGQFYGSKVELIGLLKQHFGSLIPPESDFTRLRKSPTTQMTTALMKTKRLRFLPWQKANVS